MNIGKRLKVLAAFGGLSALAAVSYYSVEVYKYFAADRMYAHAMRDPATRQSMEICIRHKLNAKISSDQPPLAEPLYSESKLLAWLTSALPVITTLDFDKIDEQITDSEHLFTPDGWCSFIEALSEANWARSIKDNKLHTKLALHAGPTIVKALPVDGIYTWFIELPIGYNVTADDNPNALTQDMDNLVLKIEIVRSSFLTNPDGIAISEWVSQ